MHANGEVYKEPEAEFNKTLSVGFVLLPKFTLMALTGFIEALRHAADVRDRSRQIHCQWQILSHNRTAVSSSCGIDIAPTQPFPKNIPYDYIIVVGGLLSGHKLIEAETIEFVKQAAKQNTSLIGLCTGSFLLARAGLMEGRKCCVSYYHIEDFETEFNNNNIRTVADTLYLIDGPRITCAGGLGSVDLAIHLIENHLGTPFAQKSVSQMVFDHVRRASAPQPRFNADWFSNVQNSTVKRAILLMELHMAEPISMELLCSKLAISVKTLERLFKKEVDMSPVSYYRTIRLDVARRMLEDSDNSIMGIALDCGFGDLSYFGRCFRKKYGVSPRSYRKKMSK